MMNIELKARCEDLGQVREALARNGVTEAAVLRQTDTYFAAHQGRLKLREQPGHAAELIQYERDDRAEQRSSSYTRVPVPDAQALKTALEKALGVRAVVEKERTLYLWKHTRVHLDSVAGLGTFLELETVVTDQTPEEAHAECREIRAALGIRPEHVLESSYAELLLDR
jgi:predicted adenylyl cyclase CyaB